MSLKSRFYKWLRRVVDRYLDVTFEKLPEPTKPQEQQEPHKQEPIPEDHIVRKIKTWWGDVNMSNAVIDPAYALTVSPDGKHWSKGPDSWKRGAAGPACPDFCWAMCAAAYQRPDGTWAGGKFEWLGGNARDWKNITNKYKGWIPPPAGTEMICWCYTADGNRVSTMAKARFG